MCVGDKENETEFKRCLALNAFLRLLDSPAAVFPAVL